MKRAYACLILMALCLGCCPTVDLKQPVDSDLMPTIKDTGFEMDWRCQILTSGVTTSFVPYTNDFTCETYNPPLSPERVQLPSCLRNYLVNTGATFADEAKTKRILLEKLKRSVAQNFPGETLDTISAYNLIAAIVPVVSESFTMPGAYSFKWKRPKATDSFWYWNDLERMRPLLADWDKSEKDVTGETDPVMTRCGRYTLLACLCVKALREAYPRFCNLYCTDFTGSRIHTFCHIFVAVPDKGKASLIATNIDFDLDRDRWHLRLGDVGYGLRMICDLNTVDGKVNAAYNLLDSLGDYEAIAELVMIAPVEEITERPSPGENLVKHSRSEALKLAYQMDGLQQEGIKAMERGDIKTFNEYMDAKRRLVSEVFAIFKASACP